MFTIRFGQLKKNICELTKLNHHVNYKPDPLQNWLLEAIKGNT